MNKLRKSWKFFLLSGVFFSTFISETYYGGALSYYYTHTLGLSIAAQSLVWSIFVILSILLGILVGITQDHFIGHKNGRRIPFIRVCGPLLGLSFALAFTRLSFVSTGTGLIFNYISILIVLFVLDGFVSSALLAIPSEEIQDEGKRSSCYIAIGIASGAALGLYFLTSQLQEINESIAVSFNFLMATIGVAASLFLFFSSFVLPHTFIQNPEAVRREKPLRSFLDCFKNRTFLIGEIYLTSVVCTTCTCMLGLYYYIGDVVELNYLTFIGLPAGIFCAWYFFSKTKSSLSRRFIYGLPIAAAIICLLLTALLGKSSLAPFFVFFAGGIGAFVQYTFNNMIIIEAVDVDEKKTGFRKEAQYIELDYIFDSIGSLCQSLFLVIILAFGYEEGLPSGAQSLHAQQGIICAAFLFPALILIIGDIAMLFFYPKEKEK